MVMKVGEISRNSVGGGHNTDILLFCLPCIIDILKLTLEDC